MQTSSQNSTSHPEKTTSARPVSRTWVGLTAAFTGFCVAWPAICALLFNGPLVLIRCLTGDAYHYLAIARKASVSHIYTYDGVHVTNGFHPLWQYSLRGGFTLLRLHSHLTQATFVAVFAFACTALGSALASAAIVRITGHRLLGLLVVPGLAYLFLGAYASLFIWAGVDGMESAYSVLFGGLLFYVASYFLGASAPLEFSSVRACRALGMVLPFLVLSRLDEVFLLPAFLLSILLLERDAVTRLTASLWIATPTSLALLAYLAYNKATAGVMMPLSGVTKARFSAHIFAYFTASIHLPFLPGFSRHFPFWLQSGPSQWVPSGEAFYVCAFRAVEVVYPLLLAVFGALAVWRYHRHKPGSLIFLAVCLGIIFKMLYNIAMVHPWDQADWYYAFASLSISVMGAYVLSAPYARLKTVRIAWGGVVTVYLLLLLLATGQFYSSRLLYPNLTAQQDSDFWLRHDAVRADLTANGITGLINYDDGITAFLLDMPMLHGFAFATDPQAQLAFRSGRMLSLATSRGINGLTGLDYMNTPVPPQTDAEIRAYLRGSIAQLSLAQDLDQYTFSLAYYDSAWKLPFIKFTPRNAGIRTPLRP